MSPTHQVGPEVQKLSNNRIWRVEGGSPQVFPGTQSVTMSPTSASVTLSPTSVTGQSLTLPTKQPAIAPTVRAVPVQAAGSAMPAAAASPPGRLQSPVSLQPRVLPVERAKIIDTQPAPPDKLQASTPTVVDSKQQASPHPLPGSILWEESPEKSGFVQSMQETHTLQIRMLEELIEQKVKKAFEVITMVSNQTEDRFTNSEAYSFELKTATDEIRHDLHNVQAQIMGLSDLHAARDLGNDKDDIIAALSNIRGDLEAMQNQHHAALSAIQMQKDQHLHLQSLHDELRHRLDFFHGAGHVPQPAPGDSQEVDVALQAQLSDLRHEAALLGTQQRQQGEQLQDMEAQVVQHLQGFKEQQQNEAMLLRQDLEATLAAGGHGEDLRDLHRKYEDVSRAVEVALNELPQDGQRTGSRGQLLDLEAGRREIGELAALLQEERGERVRTDEELCARQQRAADETFEAVNAALDEFRQEMRALADQMLRQGPDRLEIEGLVAKAVRPERDARAELTRFLEAERSGRVRDLENERKDRTDETADLRAAVQRVADGLAELPQNFNSVSELIRSEVERHFEAFDQSPTLSDKYTAVEIRLDELGSRIQAVERGHADHAATVFKALDQPSALSEKYTAVEIRLDELSHQLQAVERGHAEHAAAVCKDYSHKQELDKVVTALEAEILERCEASADINLRLEREVARVESRLETRSQETSEAMGALQLELHAGLEAERHELASVAGAQHEQSAVLRMELGKALEQERVERVAQGHKLEAAFAEAVSRERDERVSQSLEQHSETARVLAELHRDHGDAAAEREHETSSPTAGSESHGSRGNSSLLNRLFRKSRAEA